MDRDTIIVKVKKIIEKKLKDMNIESMDENINFLETYNIDSIGLMQIVFNIESEFNIVFEEENLLIENLSTISKLADIISAKV